ncbi:MAG: 1-acyl-sn-glycerol-3-phosphate acyltransferase [Bifidobacteriaceae bacterium]|nr:1-acyl-sn-glycerol-3-phosphate acyltransferase [Bifidobacteriaceae bacterium]
MFYWIARAIAGPLLRLVYRPWIRGAESIPPTGPAILAGNHLAVIDSFFLPVMVPRRISFLGKADYVEGRGIKGRLVAGFMRGVGLIPVDRRGGAAALDALKTGLGILEEGGVFGIYPEGTRSPDGRLYRGKTGVARLALESGAPVIPVAMIGTNVAQPAGKRLPKLVRTGIVIGQPMDFSRFAGMENDRLVLRSITDEIMYQLMLLSGQEYVDVYAATMKARLARGAPTPSRETEPAAPGGRPRPEGVRPPEPPEPPEPPDQASDWQDESDGS